MYMFRIQGGGGIMMKYKNFGRCVIQEREGKEEKKHEDFGKLRNWNEEREE